ncbi:hypothetical protein X801_03730, partial [Opisthorchis viverrini]
WGSLESGSETRLSHLYDCLIEDASPTRGFQPDGEETMLGTPTDATTVSADLRNRLSIDNLAAAISQSTPAQLPMSDHSDQHYDNVCIDKLASNAADIGVNGQLAYTERDPEVRQSEDFILTKVRFSQVGSKPPGCSTSLGSPSPSDTKRGGDLDTYAVPSTESAVLSSPNAEQPPTNHLSDISTNKNPYISERDASAVSTEPPVRFTLADYFDSLNNTPTTPKPLLPRLVVPAPKMTGLQTPVEKALEMSHSTSLDDISDSLLNPGGNGSESASSSVTFGHIPMDAVDYLVKRRSFLLICLAERYEELIRLLDEELELTGQPPENYNQYMHECHDAQAAAKRLRAPEPTKIEEDGSRSSDVISQAVLLANSIVTRNIFRMQDNGNLGFPLKQRLLFSFLSQREDPGLERLRTGLLGQRLQKTGFPISPMNVRKFGVHVSPSSHSLRQSSLLSLSDQEKRRSEGVLPPVATAFNAERSQSFYKQGGMLDSRDLRDSKCSEQNGMSRKAPVGRGSHIKSTSMSDIYSGVRESWMDASELEESSNSVVTMERDAVSSTDRESSLQEAVAGKGEAENGEGRESELTWINVELEALRNIMEVNLRLAADSKRKEASRKAYRLAARQNEQAINQLEEQRRILLGLPSGGKETTPLTRHKGGKSHGGITRKSGNARSASEVRISAPSDSLNGKASGQSKLSSSSTENGAVKHVLLPAPTNSVMYDGLVHTAPIYNEPIQSKPDANSSLNVNEPSAPTASTPEPDEERLNRMGTCGALPAYSKNDSKKQNSLISDPQAASSPIQNPCVRRLTRTPFPRKEQTVPPDTDHSDDGRDSGRGTLFHSSPHTCDDSKDTYSTENRTSVDSQDSTCSPTPCTYRGNNSTPVVVRHHTIQANYYKDTMPSPGPLQSHFEDGNSPVDYRMPTQEAFMYSRLPAYNNGSYPTRTDGYELPCRGTFAFTSHIPYEVEVKKATPPYSDEPYFPVSHRVMPSMQMRPAHQAASVQELYDVSSVSDIHVFAPEYNRPPPYPSLQAHRSHPNPQNFNVGSRSRTPDPMRSATRGIRPVDYEIQFESQPPSDSGYYPNTTSPGYDPLPHSFQPLYYDRTHFAMPTRSSPSF